jgi:hypothetical protein
MKRITICTLIPLLYLTACSGDGSNIAGTNNPPPPPAAGFSITPSNGLAVTKVAYESAVTSGEVAGFAGNSTGSSAGGGLAKPSAPQQYGGTLTTLLQKVPLPAATTDCAVAGSVTVTMNVEDILLLSAGVLSAGDTILAEYSGCDEGLGEVLDGTIDSIVDAFEGNIFSFAYDMTMTMNLVDFSATTDTEMLTVNGDGTATLKLLQAPYLEASVSGDYLTTVTNATTETLRDYSSVQTYDGRVAPAPYTMTATGTLESSELSGSVTYSTPVMFEGVDTGYPTSGELLVVSEASSARLIAQSNGIDVVIEIYSNATGTGTPDSTINTTWAELEAL